MAMKFFRSSNVAVMACLACLVVNSSWAMSGEIDYDRDVRPILSQHCYQCHGPDPETREAGLRLDIGDEAANVIDVDSPADSELLVRILDTDPDLVMPPPGTAKPLSSEQVQVLRQWIEGGARFQEHWAFVPPTRPDLPTTSLDEWTRNPIDAFVARKLEDEGLRPSKPADAATLIRRLSLDLTGLPPTPERVDRFVSELVEASDAEQVYQSLVSELLDSPHYGERWGRLWLDAARYADSDGYEKDKPREAWFYRDWVIDSFNGDRSFDDFIIRQVAGDLMPNATQDDHVATGFLRNSMVNEEGGADPEQFRMEAMYDRMDAIGKSVLGLTIQCAQCHTHKYDPIQHDDYYGLFAYLNNTSDAIIPVFTETDQAKRAAVLAIVADEESQLKRQYPDWARRMSEWESDVDGQSVVQWTTPELDFIENTVAGIRYRRISDGSYLPEGYRPTQFEPTAVGRYDANRLSAMRIEMLNHPSLARSGPGRSIDGTWALSEIKLKVALSSDPEKFTAVTFASARADLSPAKADLQKRYNNKKPGAKKDPAPRVTGPVDYAIDGDVTTAWTNEVGQPLANKSQVAWFELETPIEIPDGEHLLFNLALVQKHGGWNSDDNQTFSIGRHRVSFTGDALPDSQFASDANGDDWDSASLIPIYVRDALAVPTDERSDVENSILFSYWRTTQTEFAETNERIAAAWATHPHGSTQLTLQQLSSPRVTSVLNRGDFLSPTHEVQPHTPEFLNAMPPSDEPDRLRFARWLVSRDSPTTARAFVNRVWQAYYGIGLVETSDDLGSQSAPPSHSELLDWLAVDFMQNSWSMKTLHRTIVTSATYRQSSKTRLDLAEVDPYNRLIARGARFRVPAETVRDIALSASGLLSKKVGGPSVTPPAPGFLFEPPVSYGPKTWEEAVDDDRYRRAIYTFRFRSVLYPMLEAFDAVPGNVSCVRRGNSNTPMQALTLLNEPLFMECAAGLADRAINECLGDDAERCEFVLRQCIVRRPDATEVDALTTFVRQQRERFNSGELDADQMLNQLPKTLAGFASDTDKSEWAVWALASRVALSLDETITRD